MSGTRRGAATLLSLLLTVVLTGCGNREQSYCAALEADQKTFAEMQADTSGLALLRHRAMLGQLAANAPDDLDDEWQTLLGAIDAFDDTLHGAGVKPGEFVDGKPPAGLSPTKREQIAQAASELSSADVVEAANGIQQEARDVCQLQLGL